MGLESPIHENESSNRSKQRIKKSEVALGLLVLIPKPEGSRFYLEKWTGLTYSNEITVSCKTILYDEGNNIQARDRECGWRRFGMLELKCLDMISDRWANKQCIQSTR